jgi:hypothetical protein
MLSLLPKNKKSPACTRGFRFFLSDPFHATGYHGIVQGPLALRHKLSLALPFFISMFIIQIFDRIVKGF